MTRRVRCWLFAAMFFVVSGVLVAMPSIAQAGITATAVDRYDAYGGDQSRSCAVLDGLKQCWTFATDGDPLARPHRETGSTVPTWPLTWVELRGI
jgi:hypothetical protein